MRGEEGRASAAEHPQRRHAGQQLLWEVLERAAGISQAHDPTHTEVKSTPGIRNTATKVQRSADFVSGEGTATEEGYRVPKQQHGS